MQLTKPKKTNAKERESRMVRPVASLLHDLGFAHVTREVPYFYSVVDLFGTGATGNVAVEMKLTRWQKAISQARIYQLFARRVYVSMPAAYADRPARDVLRDTGIGLIAVEFTSLRPLVGTAVVLVEAKDSAILKPHHAEMMAEKAQRLGRKKWHRVRQ